MIRVSFCSSVGRQLRDGAMVQSEMFDLVTIMFLDIPCVTDFVQAQLPVDVTECLAGLDELIQNTLSQVA